LKDSDSLRKRRAVTLSTSNNIWEKRNKIEKEDKESIPDQLQLLYFEDVNGLLII